MTLADEYRALMQHCNTQKQIEDVEEDMLLACTEFCCTYGGTVWVFADGSRLALGRDDYED